MVGHNSRYALPFELLFTPLGSQVLAVVDIIHAIFMFHYAIAEPKKNHRAKHPSASFVKSAAPARKRHIHVLSPVADHIYEANCEEPEE